MKFAIGFEIQDGPWGGGNRFVKSLVRELESSGHSVFFDLSSPDLDFIIMIDPRSRLPNIPFGPRHILSYLMKINPKALVIHRINECDERKGTHTMNARLRLANYCADHTVFVGEWLKKINLWQSAGFDRTSVIHNGADSAVFNSDGFTPWTGSGPLRLVTHHWGGNRMKGFDVYQYLDGMLGKPEWARRLSFTYIGNLPKGFRFRNSRYVEPLDGEALAAELRKHHGYLTASINEPGGNHQNEGALCGLPMLYRNSGCLPEYLDGYGIMFDDVTDFHQSLLTYMDQYASLVPAMSGYPKTADRCIKAWMDLFETLNRRRPMIADSRQVWRKPASVILNQLVA